MIPHAIAGTIAASGIYDRFDRLPEVRSALAAWQATTTSGPAPATAAAAGSPASQG